MTIIKIVAVPIYRKKMLKIVHFNLIIIYVIITFKFVSINCAEKIIDSSEIKNVHNQKQNHIKTTIKKFNYFGKKNYQKRKIEEKNAQVSVTFPGTKWCGPGNTANGYEDLGKYEEVDKCCREHDHCDNIAAGEEKYGLRNDDWFTRLHCKCDKNFFECLHAANTTVSDVIGRQYFLLRDRCYKEDYPIEGCNQYQSKVFIRRCIKYNLDQRQSKKYQWFDLPLYDTMSFPSDLKNLSDDEKFYEDQDEWQQKTLLTNEIV